MGRLHCLLQGLNKGINESLSNDTLFYDVFDFQNFLFKLSVAYPSRRYMSRWTLGLLVSVSDVFLLFRSV
jgi:hypothetical protein